MTGHPVRRVERPQDVVVKRIGVATDGLDSRGVVDVRHRGNRGARHVQSLDPPQLPGIRRAAAAAAPAERPPRAACTDCPRRDRTTRATCSRRTEGANGRNDSRNLILRFITDCILGERASPRMDGAPSARGPNSIRPWKSPTTFSSASIVATTLGERHRSRSAVDGSRGWSGMPPICFVAEPRPEIRRRSCRRIRRRSTRGSSAAEGRTQSPRRLRAHAGLVEIPVPQAERERRGATASPAAG